MRKKLLIGLAFALLSLAGAQKPYVGGHVGFFGSSGLNLLNFGVHSGLTLGPGMPELRAGLDVTSISGVTITGFNADLLYAIPLQGGEVQPYAGVGGNVWLSPAGTDFGAHVTLGGRVGISGTPLSLFVEVQPGYAFGGSGAFVYYFKAGANYGF